MIMEWYFGFHRPQLRNDDGNIDLRRWFGHCEAWGYSVDDTWVFIDPHWKGLKFTVAHKYDEVIDNLEEKNARCRSILKIASDQPDFSLPLHIPMTCASVCGAIVGIRALVPSTLRKKLLRIGATEILNKG